MNKGLIYDKLNNIKSYADEISNHIENKNYIQKQVTFTVKEIEEIIEELLK